MHFLQAPWRGCWQDGASSSSLVRGVAQMAQGVVGAADRSKPPLSLASRTWAAMAARAANTFADLRLLVSVTLELPTFTNASGVSASTAFHVKLNRA